MENPTNTFESKDKAFALIQSILEEYDSDTRQIIDNYLDISNKKIGDQDMKNDIEQRAVLIPLTEKIGLFYRQLKDFLDTQEYTTDEPGYTSSIRSLYGIICRVKDLIQKAPDRRYSSVNLSEAYGGKENVSAGTETYEQTQEAVLNLKSTINGVKIGLSFTK